MSQLQERAAPTRMLKLKNQLPGGGQGWPFILGFLHGNRHGCLGKANLAAYRGFGDLSLSS